MNEHNVYNTWDLILVGLAVSAFFLLGHVNHLSTVDRQYERTIRRHEAKLARWEQWYDLAIPKCEEDQVLVGLGSFSDGRWERYFCGPAYDDFYEGAHNGHSQ